MSCGKHDAEMKFLKTPELIETLLLFLDVSSARSLAQALPLALDVLQSVVVWNNLVQRSIPENRNTDLTDESLHDLVPKVTSLARILLLMGGSRSPQLDLNLLHTICESFPFLRGPSMRSVTLSCSCQKTHSVSPLGLVLLEMVEYILGTAVQTANRIHVGELGYKVTPTLMESMNSRAARQQKMVAIDFCLLATCNSNEEARGFSLLMKNSKNANVENIEVKGEIGKEGWSAVSCAIQLLHERNPELVFHVFSTREAMTNGDREDLRVIWDSMVGADADTADGIGGTWEMESLPDPIGVLLLKAEGEEEWERLEQILDMTAEEWEAELQEVNQDDEELNLEEDDEEQLDAEPNEGQ